MPPGVEGEGKGKRESEESTLQAEKAREEVSWGRGAYKQCSETDARTYGLESEEGQASEANR